MLAVVRIIVILEPVIHEAVILEPKAIGSMQEIMDSISTTCFQSDKSTTKM